MQPPYCPRLCFQCMRKHGIVTLIAEQVKYLYICSLLTLLIILEYSIPAMGDRFSVVIETVHLPDAGGTHNVNNFTSRCV